MQPIRKAFVIMPFEPEFDEIYNQLIKPALEDAGYFVSRADSFLNQQNILRDIIRGITEANLVVAELTTQNANVFYELGVCHGLDIPTILIAQTFDDIPFDLKPYRVIPYDVRFDQVTKLKQELKKIGEQHNRGEITFGNPVTDFSAVNKKEKISTQSRSETKEDIEQSQEPAETEIGKKGYLDFIVEGVQSLQEQSKIINLINQEMQTNTAKLNAHNTTLGKLQGNKDIGVTTEARKIAIQLAKDLLDYTGKIQELIPQLELSIESSDENMTGYLNWVDLKQEKQRADGVALKEAITNLGSMTHNARSSMLATKNKLMPLGEINREMSIAVDKLANAIDQLINVYDKQEAFCQKLISLLTDKLS